uniref:Uncharacterized protein n=1 Tax=viral metagenome TaxID=1070528 RepID=A0A6M3LS05_9ZZZZ
MNNICLNCGASRDALTDMLKECAPTDNFEIAVKMIKNCRECEERLVRLMNDCIVIVKNIRKYSKVGESGLEVKDINFKRV